MSRYSYGGRACKIADFQTKNLGIEREKDLAQKFIAQAAGNKQLSDWQNQEEKYIAQICQLEDEVKKLRQQLSHKGDKK